jgi:two-component response regulator (ARR-B family)
VIKSRFVLSFLHFVGLFGELGMILYLINQMNLIFCRLCGPLLIFFCFIGFNNGFSLLLPEQRDDMVTGCNQMLVVAHDFFFQATGWRHLHRIGNA